MILAHHDTAAVVLTAYDGATLDSTLHLAAWMVAHSNAPHRILRHHLLPAPHTLAHFVDPVERASLTHLCLHIIALPVSILGVRKRLRLFLLH